MNPLSLILPSDTKCISKVLLLDFITGGWLDPQYLPSDSPLSSTWNIAKEINVSEA